MERETTQMNDLLEATETASEATVYENGCSIAETKMEPSSPLYAALHAIYGEVERLEKTEHNNHGNYKFAPADSFRDFIRQRFHAHNLIYIINEVYSPFIGEVAKQKTLKFTFEFVILHIESGETTPAVRRSVFLPYVGSQTAGIASTFALKEWLKNQFLISTGEPDPEGTMGKDDDAAKSRMTEQDSKSAYDNLIAGLRALPKDHSQADVFTWWNANISIISALSDGDFKKLQTEAEKAKMAATNE